MPLGKAPPRAQDHGRSTRTNATFDLLGRLVEDLRLSAVVCRQQPRLRTLNEWLQSERQQLSARLHVLKHL